MFNIPKIPRGIAVTSVVYSVCITIYGIYQSIENDSKYFKSLDAPRVLRLSSFQDLQQNSLTNRIMLDILNMSESSFVDIWINRETVHYDDPILVEYVRQNYLTRPFTKDLYNLTSEETNPSQGQIQSVWKFLKNITSGFFIDCGANDGEFISNTLWLEKEKGWDGLLIEADPGTFATLKTKRRKAWHANLCLSPITFPKLANFYQSEVKNDGLNGLRQRSNMGNVSKIQVQCMPLYTILLALNQTVIDFFSLDIEGMELHVLKTIPFDKVLIKTLAIEHWSVPGGAKALYKFMTSKGYRLHKIIRASLSQDSIYVHASLPTPK